MKKYEEFTTNENITLSEDEKKYFWSKIEYSKKKKAIENENELYTALTSEGDLTISEDEFVKFLNMLEYTIKKDMKNSEKRMRNPIAQSFKEKIPDSFIGVKYSNLKMKKKKEEKSKEDETSK